MKKKMGRPQKYDFKPIRKGKWYTIHTDNIKSCRNCALKYAKLHGFEITTQSLGEDQLMIYRL